MHVIRQLGAAVTAFAGSALLLTACRGCASDSDAPAGQAEDAGTEFDSRRDALTDPTHEPDGLGEPSPDAPLDAPVEHEEVPPGWEAWTGWSAACPIYIPGPGAELPASIEWEACPVALSSEYACSRMKVRGAEASRCLQGTGGSREPLGFHYRDHRAHRAIVVDTQLDSSWPASFACAGTLGPRPGISSPTQENSVSFAVKSGERRFRRSR